MAQYISFAAAWQHVILVALYLKLNINDFGFFCFNSNTFVFIGMRICRFPWSTQYSGEEDQVNTFATFGIAIAQVDYRSRYVISQLLHMSY